jgi:hypothetical protein
MKHASVQICAVLCLLFVPVALGVAAQPMAPQFRVAGEAASRNLAGIVTDSANAPIPNATVLIHWDGFGLSRTPHLGPGSTALLDIRLTTNILGQFSANLIPGFYDVLVVVDGYEPSRHQLVEVRDERTIYQWFWLTSLSQS